MCRETSKPRYPRRRLRPCAPDLCEGSAPGLCLERQRQLLHVFRPCSTGWPIFGWFGRNASPLIGRASAKNRQHLPMSFQKHFQNLFSTDLRLCLCKFPVEASRGKYFGIFWSAAPSLLFGYFFLLRRFAVPRHGAWFLAAAQRLRPFGSGSRFDYLRHGG